MRNVSEFRITTRAACEWKPGDDPPRFFHTFRMEFDVAAPPGPPFVEQKRLYFMFTADELREALAGERTCVTDLMHVCKIDMGSLWMFFDTPCPAPSHGEFTTTYHRFEFTRDLRDELRAAIEQSERAWMRQPERSYGGRDDIDLDLSHRLPEWRTWHQGAGQAEFDTGGDALTADKLAYWRDRDEEFARCAERLLQIARNRTWKPEDVAVCKVRWHDYAGEFSFFVGGMSGGIINHGKNADKPDWSIHT
jgi:hypothetical protein